MSMSGLSTAVSGLQAAQLNLYVTGHNMANSRVAGFTRQQVIQSDFRFRTVGRSSHGPSQIGMGTSVDGIRQIRDRFLDIQFRDTVPRAHYFEVRYNAGLELSSIFGELEGQYRLHSVLRDLSQALHELNVEPHSLDARGNFLTFAGNFIDKMNNASRAMHEYQLMLNNSIIGKVQRVNQLLTEIDHLNRRITMEELGGSRANDFRDARNNALDELATLIEIQVVEGRHGVEVFSNGNVMLSGGFINRLGTRFTGPNTNFVEPVFTSADHTLAFDPTFRNARSLFNYSLFADAYTTRNGAEHGSLLGAIVARGLTPANHASYPPMTQAEVLAAFNDIFALPPVMTNPPLTGPPNNYFDAFNTAYAAFLLDFAAYLANPTLTRPVMPDLPALPPTAIVIIDALPPAERAEFDSFMTLHSNSHQMLMGVEHQFFMAEHNRFNMTVGQIPRVQAELDTLVNAIINMFNDAFAPLTGDAPFGLGPEGNQPQHVALFVREGFRFQNADGTRNSAAENIFLAGSLYTMGNVVINPALLRQGGSSLLALSRSGDESDNVVLQELIQKWSSEFINFGDGQARSIDGFYRRIVERMAVETQRFGRGLDATVDEILELDNRRLSISGASVDEEMSNMIRFQHAYNAAARVLNTIDSMIDRIINGTGRVGI